MRAMRTQISPQCAPEKTTNLAGGTAMSAVEALNIPLINFWKADQNTTYCSHIAA